MTHKQLRAWRDRMKLTQKQAAKLLKVPLSSYCQWEYDRITPHALLGPATRWFEMLHCDEVRDLDAKASATVTAF